MFISEALAQTTTAAPAAGGGLEGLMQFAPLVLIFIAKRGMLTGMAGAAVLGVGLKLILSI